MFTILFITPIHYIYIYYLNEADALFQANGLRKTCDDPNKLPYGNLWEIPLNSPGIGPMHVKTGRNSLQWEDNRIR